MTKTTSAALAALLATRQFYTAKLFTFTLADGTPYYFCSGDTDITSGGNVFSCGGVTGPFFEKGDNKARAHWKIGTEVDTLTFDVLPGDGMIRGLSWLSAAIYGLFDGATVLYQKAYMPTYGDVSAGVYDMFLGRVGDVSLGRSIITFTVNSHLELLNQNMPLNFYQAGCNNTLYDSSCGVDPALFSATGVVAVGSTAGIIRASMAAATGYFDLGKLTFTSGMLSGMSVGIKSWVQGTPGTFTMNRPFPTTPVDSDAFTAFAGCNKKQTTCAGKFSNFANFRGTPYVPVPETAA